MRVFAIVIKRSQLVLFCAVWENKDFLSQNTAAETSNQHQEFLSRLHKNRAHISKIQQITSTSQKKQSLHKKRYSFQWTLQAYTQLYPHLFPPIPKRSLEKAPSID